MEISALQSNVRAADLPLEQLANNSHLSPADKVAEASRQFEAVLLRQILTDATKTIFKSSVNPASSSDSIYQDLITNNLADQMSHSGGLGLSRALSKQLQHELKTDAPPAAGPSKV